MLGPGHVERQAYVAVWFLDPFRMPECHLARAACLHEDSTRWTDEILRVWQDYVRADFDLNAFLVAPDPPDREANFLGHVILVQRAQTFSNAILVSAFDQACCWRPGHQVCHFCPSQNHERDYPYCICGQWMLQDLCSVWHGRFQLLPEVPFEADHGQRLSVTELLARTLGTKRPLERYCCRYVRESRVPNPFPAFAEECDLHSATSPCARSASTTRMFCPRAR